MSELRIFRDDKPAMPERVISDASGIAKVVSTYVVFVVCSGYKSYNLIFNTANSLIEAV